MAKQTNNRYDFTLDDLTIQQYHPLEPTQPWVPDPIIPVDPVGYVEFRETSPFKITNEAQSKEFRYQLMNARVDDIYIESIDYDGEWCRISTTGVASVTVEFDESHYYAERSADLTIEWYDYAEMKTKYTKLRIVQDYGEAYFYLENINYNISYSAQTINVPIEVYDDNVNISVSSNVSWLTPIINPQQTNIAIQAKINTTESRTGVITVSANDYQETITINQAKNTTVGDVIFEPNPLYVSNIIGQEYYVYFNPINDAHPSRISSMLMNTHYSASINTREKYVKITVDVRNTGATEYKETISIEEISGERRSWGFQVIQPSLYDVKFTPNVLRFKADGTPYETNFATLNIDPSEISYYEWLTDTPDWYKLKWEDTKVKTTITRIDVNELSELRENREILSITLSNDISINCPIDIIQDGAKPYIESPIWKDTYYVFSGDTYNNSYYRLITNNNEIYRGKVYYIGNQSGIKINNIIEDYINVLNNPFGSLFNDNNAYIDVLLQSSQDGSNWTDEQLYHFYYNYDYNENKQAILTNPIQDYIDPRCYMLFTIQDYYLHNGSTPFEFTVFDENGNEKQFGTNVNNKQLTLCVPMTNAKEVQYSLIDGEGKTITVDERCSDYCLYYLQPNGGWCWFLFEGKCTKSKQLNSDFYQRNANNTVPSMFGKTKYHLGYTTKYELTTGYLTDIQSEKFTDIFLSPYVYLHDLTNGRLVSVNIMDNTVTHKKFFNQGKKAFQYTLNVEESQQSNIKG